MSSTGRMSAAGASETILQRQLAGASPEPKVTAVDVLRLARARFMAGERVEMGALAEELGMNRVTVYRWVGSREQLLVEVLWSLAEPTLERERGVVNETGGERVVRILTNFIVAVLSNTGVNRFVEQEGELALRLMTRADAGFQPRLIEWVEKLLVEECAAGRLELRADISDYAYALVRVLESYVSLDLITGEKPDAERAEHVLRLLLVR
jgi:AcrR family transcriptional regulator